MIMRHNDDFDEGSGLPFRYMILIGTLFVATVLGVVVLANRHSEAKKEAAFEAREREVEELTSQMQETIETSSGLRSEDLDFWHMYDEPVTSTEKKPLAATETESEESETEPVQDASTDGRHTKIVGEDGTEEWIELNQQLTTNDYDLNGFVYQYPIMKYYADSKKVSRVGAKISSENGEVNFKKLKKEGVDFVMIRMGYRGYGSGLLNADDLFYVNVERAEEAGLDWGPYFFSQATSREEVLEEATRVQEGLQGFSPKYPVAYDMEYVQNDTARVQSLSKEQKTDFALTFCQAMNMCGYKAIVYGNKDWLLRKLDLTKLVGNDIWLSQPQDIPDYPYKYTMWEYTKDAKIGGIEEPAALSICLVDYGAK